MDAAQDRTWHLLWTHLIPLDDTCSSFSEALSLRWKGANT